MAETATVIEGIDLRWLEEHVESDPLRHAYARWDASHPSAPARFRSVLNAGLQVGYLLHWLGRPSLPVVHIVGSFGELDWIGAELPAPPSIVVAPPEVASEVARVRPGVTSQAVSLMRLDRAPEESSADAESGVRPLAPEDAPALAELLGRAPTQLAWSLPAFDIVDPDVFGAFIGNTLVSVARAAVRLADIWILTGIYTRPEFRGKGYGAAAVRAACRAAVQRSGRAGLYVFDENEAAIRVYRRLGFKPTGRVFWIDWSRLSQT